MTSFHSGPPIRARSIAEIARGKLHHYGIESIPRNPYAYGSLRHHFRANNTHRLDSPELRHLKSEGEKKMKELIEKLPTQESAYESIDELKKPRNKGPKETEIDGRKFEVDAWHMNYVEKDGQTVMPFYKLETEEQRKRRKETGFATEAERLLHEIVVKQREENLERGGAEL